MMGFPEQVLYVESTADPGPNRTYLSLVIPVYNEQDVLPELFRRVSAVIDDLPVDRAEVIVVSDGSADQTDALIRRQVQEDGRYRGVLLSRNFGHQPAVTAGLAVAEGSVVAVIDGDLQDPPELIGDMLAQVNRGADVIYAVRQHRREGALLRAAYWGFYRLLNMVAQVHIPLDAGDFCVMRRPVVDAMLALPERRRFTRGLRAWVGFRQAPFAYSRESRFAGKPKYNLRRLVRLAYDGLFAFSDLPVKLMQWIGFGVTGLAVLISLIYFVLALIQPTPAGFPTLMLSVWFLGGVQMLAIGLIGEYLHRAYEQTLNRPTVLIRQVLRNEGA